MNICIFGSSSMHISQLYFEEAAHLGELIGKSKHTLIHGGGKEGIMGKVAEHVQLHGGTVIGIIPEKLDRKGIVREEDDQTIVTATMAGRKEKMFECADAFIALPGGFGTLEELLEIITLNQLDYTQKPIVILNSNHYYQYLLKQFDYLFEENFALQKHRTLYQVADSPREVFEYLKQ